jgi:hypothetical protein
MFITANNFLVIVCTTVETVLYFTIRFIYSLGFIPRELLMDCRSIAIVLKIFNKFYFNCKNCNFRRLR